MSYSIQIQLPPKDDDAEFDVLQSITVGAACFYSMEKKNCTICGMPIYTGEIVFKYVYDVTEGTMKFKGQFDLDCFFQVFRVRSYLYLDGFHELMMADRALIEDRIFEAWQMIYARFDDQKKLLFEMQLKLKDVKIEDLQLLIDENISGALPPELSREALLKIAADFICFGAIVDTCVKCEGQLLPALNEYYCKGNKNADPDFAHTTSYKQHIVGRDKLDIPEELKERSPIIAELLKEGFGVPVDRLLGNEVAGP